MTLPQPDMSFCNELQLRARLSFLGGRRSAGSELSDPVSGPERRRVQGHRPVDQPGDCVNCGQLTAFGGRRITPRAKLRFLVQFLL